MGDAAYYRALEASQRRLNELRAATREKIRRVEDEISKQHLARMAEKEQKIHDGQFRNSNSNAAKKNAADI